MNEILKVKTLTLSPTINIEASTGKLQYSLTCISFATLNLTINQAIQTIETFAILIEIGTLLIYYKIYFVLQSFTCTDYECYRLTPIYIVSAETISIEKQTNTIMPRKRKEETLEDKEAKRARDRERRHNRRQQMLATETHEERRTRLDKAAEAQRNRRLRIKNKETEEEHIATLARNAEQVATSRIIAQQRETEEEHAARLTHHAEEMAASRLRIPRAILL